MPSGFSGKGWGFARWWAIFCVSLTPFLYLIYLVLTRGLGPDPGEAIVAFNGEWSLIFLLICLTVTPFNRLFGWKWLVRFRRMLGLYAWFYALLHVTGAVLLVLDVSILLEEIVKRPYILVGLVAFCILTMLAITSPKKMVRKLGRRWKPLHRTVYIAALLVMVHYIWQIRADYTEAVIYSLVLGWLLGIRYYWSRIRVSRAVRTSTNAG